MDGYGVSVRRTDTHDEIAEIPFKVLHYLIGDGVVTTTSFDTHQFLRDILSYLELPCFVGKDSSDSRISTTYIIGEGRL